MRDSFSDRHPLVNFLFFAAAVTFSMFVMQPVCLGLSLVCASAYAVYLNGSAVRRTLRWLIPTAVLITLVNTLFNHRGETILTYFPWGNPLTLESMLYGFASALLICAVALWFSCVNRVMTSDKLVFLFGRVAPSLSLVLSMALRFVPRFSEQLRQVKQAQACFLPRGKQHVIQRLQTGLHIFGIMVSWSLENAIDTSDSMKSRGYGLKGRTSYARYSFHGRDAVILAAILTESAALAGMLWSGMLRYRWFPSLRGELIGAPSAVFYVLYAALLLTPLIINIGEAIKWKRLRSSI